MADSSNLTNEVRDWMDRLRASLPECVDAAASGVWSKAPFQLLCTREAIIWRTEEVARNACDALERNDFAVAAILTRVVTENAAMTWELMDILDQRRDFTPESLNGRLMRLLAGTKRMDGPNPVHVLDLLRKIDKAIPGVMAGYDGLSEMVHPNWSGVVGMFSEPDPKTFITRFGRGLRSTGPTLDMIANALLGSPHGFRVCIQPHIHDDAGFSGRA